MTAPPPRLFVLTATGSDAAIVLRRGPADWVAAIGWDRATDSFGEPHWLRGRIYEHGADISPDGRWGWADIRDGRLFCAAEGCLWSAVPHGNGKEVDARCIEDFSQMRPDSQP